MKLTFGLLLGIAFLILTIAVLIEQFILMYHGPKRHHGNRHHSTAGAAVSGSSKQH